MSEPEQEMSSEAIVGRCAMSGKKDTFPTNRRIA